eukprot:10884619-Lingulodinium_polyedra.AAC.1
MTTQATRGRQNAKRSSYDDDIDNSDGDGWGKSRRRSLKSISAPLSSSPPACDFCDASSVASPRGRGATRIARVGARRLQSAAQG